MTGLICIFEKFTSAFLKVLGQNHPSIFQFEHLVGLVSQNPYIRSYGWQKSSGTVSPFLLYSGMNDYVSKCGLWTSTTSTAWELVRKANSLSSETSEVGSSNLCFNKHSQVTLMHTNVWVTLPYITYREIIKIYALLASNPFKKTSSI